MENSKKKVLDLIKATTSDAGKQDPAITHNFYAIAHSQLLNTKEERDAYRYGTLAVLAAVAGKRLSRWYYERKAVKTLKRLGNMQ